MAKDLSTERNADQIKLLAAESRRRWNEVSLGGGKKRLEKLAEQGKLSARERVKRLLDPGTPQVEIGAFAADGMYAEHGGCPSAGVVVVLGRIAGRTCLVVANDATVKAGAWFPMTGKKKPSRPRNSYGEPYSHTVLGRFRRRLPAHARRNFCRQGAFWADF